MDAKLIRVTAKGGVALILPNMNADLRALPASVTTDVVDPTKAVALDKDKPVRRPTDPQLYQLNIEVTAAERAAHPTLLAVLSGLTPVFVLLDTSGRPVTSSSLDIAAEFAKSTKATAGALTFFIEAETYTVSPAIPAPPPTLKVDFTENNQVLSSVVLPLFVSDLLLVGDGESASRLYIADMEDNQPTLVEVREGTRGSGVPVVTVPSAVCNGDTWLQDQFQFALAFDDRATVQAVAVHLPRMRSGSQVVNSSDNLAAFVDNHFPSRDISVFKDFWNSVVTIPVSNTQGGSTSLQLKVKDSNSVLNDLMPVVRAWNQITTAISRLKGASVSQPLPTPFFTKRSQLTTQLNVLKATPANNPDQKRDKDTLTASLDLKLVDIDKAVPLAGNAVRMTINKQTVQVSDQALNDLFEQLTDLHSSTNYGGNIEVSPPTADAALGKVVTGDIASQDVQTTLTRIAGQTAAQPWVSIATNWLSVGHIDEIASFITPSASGIGSPAVLRASPNLALALLDAAKRAQGNGTLVTRLFRGKRWRHEDDRATTDPLLPPGAYQFLISSYGKYDMSDFRTPTQYVPMGPSAFFDDRKYLFYLPGNFVAREYAAHMSVTEVLDICRETNRTIDDVLLGGKGSSAKQSDYPLMAGIPGGTFTELIQRALDSMVKQSFSTAVLIGLPVLFDRVDLFANGTTEAITPGLVNLQQLGRTVLIPRPIGPRMRPGDAIALLNTFLADGSSSGLPSALLQAVRKLLTAANLHSRGLDVTTHWTSPSQSCLRWEPAALNNKNFKDAVDAIDAVAEIFRDGFDEFINPDRDYTKSDTSSTQTARKYFDANIPLIRQRIDKANPGVFASNGYVNGNTWVRVVIPENTVDIFQVYTHLVLEALGLTVKWVDSWFYHVHAGGIHCATNVLRTINPAEIARRAAAAAKSQQGRGLR
jgi:Protein-arginine deiminase (PAD)